MRLISIKWLVASMRPGEPPNEGAIQDSHMMQIVIFFISMDTKPSDEILPNALSYLGVYRPPRAAAPSRLRRTRKVTT